MAKHALSHGRTDIIKIDPNDPKFVVDEAQHNHSRWTGGIKTDDKARTRQLAEQIVLRHEGTDGREYQDTPVTIRKDGDKHVLSVGFQRTKALRLINSDASFRKRVGLKKGDVLYLLARPARQNEDDSLIANLDENLVRQELSPMDKAQCVSKLETSGLTDQQISDRYPQIGSVNWVGQLKKLFELDKPTQLLVHTGELGVQAAIELTDISADERAEVIEKARADARGNQSINGASIRTAKRDKAIERAEKTGSEVTGTKPLSIKEIRAAFTSEIEEYEHHPDVANLFKTLLGFVNGKKSQKQVQNAAEKVLAAKKSSSKAA